ncbi:MAG: hypothetical protein SGARI_000412, partial [Bacillariaceae sp.]
MVPDDHEKYTPSEDGREGGMYEQKELKDSKIHRDKAFPDADPVDEDLEDEDLQRVDTSRVREMVVDKVPSAKRWSTKHTDHFPIWPPIIKVLNYEKQHMSGVSIGSGFSDSLTASEGDFLSSLGDNSLSTEEEIALLLPEQQTTYRIRYDGPTELENLRKIYKLPPVPSRDDRFEPLSPSTNAPGRPSRSATRPDSLPQAPRRDSSLENLDDVSLGDEKSKESRSRNRPEVWMTPSDVDAVSKPVWKVKRVWAVEEEDEKEAIHSVHSSDLLSKIKTLVGAPDSPSLSSSPAGGSRERLPRDEIPRTPSRSWHVLSVVERNGRMEDLEPEKEFGDDELQENINGMSEEAVKEIESNKKSVEEAKKRIRLLRDSNLKDQRKTLRRQPLSKRHLLDSNEQDEIGPVSNSHNVVVNVDTKNANVAVGDTGSHASPTSVSDEIVELSRPIVPKHTNAIKATSSENTEASDEIIELTPSITDEVVELSRPAEDAKNLVSGEILELSKPASDTESGDANEIVELS